MTREENILHQHLGNTNHFKVPAGYFDQLADRVMVKLPEQEARQIDIRTGLTIGRTLRRIAAAVAVVALLGGGAWIALQQQGQGQSRVVAHTAAQATHEHSTASAEDETFDEMANYTMMDNQTIYASLIAEN